MKSRNHLLFVTNYGRVINMNILLIDDEEFVLDYVENIIEQMEIEIKQIFRASSVNEALTILNEHIVEMMITDIQMPEMDGLALLKMLKELNIQTKTIILSGYSEFTFAQKAIQYGAVEYLLKPIMQDELEEVLIKVIKEIEKDRETKQKFAVARSALRMELSKSRGLFLLDLLYGKTFTPTEFKQQIQTLEIDLTFDEQFIVTTVQVEMVHEDFRQVEEKMGILQFVLLNVSAELFYKNVSESSQIWVCKDQYNFIHLVIPLRLFNHDMNQAIRLLKRLKEKVTSFLKLNLSILISEPYHCKDDLHAHYTEILAYFLQSCDSGKNFIHIMSDKSKASNYQSITNLNEYPTILDLMEMNEWSEALNKINIVLEKLEEQEYYSHSQLLEIAYYLYSCFSYMSQKLGDAHPKLVNGLALIQNPFQIQSTEYIRKWAQSFINHFNEADHDKEKGNSFLIYKINKFIEQNMNKDVSLKTIGEHVYLHPVYLSRMYKKETGISISSYILKIRMDKSVILLTSTNKKVADIAKEVGYQKTQYFIQLFKDTFGVTPQKYREQCVRN